MDFTKLPTEIKFAIWEYSVEVRNIEIDFDNSNLSTRTAPPVILHVSQDSRSFGLKRLYQIVDLPILETTATNPKERYFFFNSGADTLFFRTPSIDEIVFLGTPFGPYRDLLNCNLEVFTLQLKRLLINRIRKDILAPKSVSFGFDLMKALLHWFDGHEDDYLALFRGQYLEIAIGHPQYLPRMQWESFPNLKAILDGILDERFHGWPRRMRRVPRITFVRREISSGLQNGLEFVLMQ